MQHSHFHLRQHTADGKDMFQQPAWRKPERATAHICRLLGTLPAKLLHATISSLARDAAAASALALAGGQRAHACLCSQRPQQRLVARRVDTQVPHTQPQLTLGLHQCGPIARTRQSHPKVVCGAMRGWPKRGGGEGGPGPSRGA
jgi:hypothetical protein